MTTHPLTAAAATPATFSIAPGQSLWTCLAPGSSLLITQGRVAIRPAPHPGGQAASLPPIAVMDAGEHLVWHASPPQAAWIQIDSTARQAAEVTVVEKAQAPGLASKVWGRLQRTFLGARDGAIKARGAGGACGPQPAHCIAK